MGRRLSVELCMVFAALICALQLVHGLRVDDEPDSDDLVEESSNSDESKDEDGSLVEMPEEAAPEADKFDSVQAAAEAEARFERIGKQIGHAALWHTLAEKTGDAAQGFVLASKIDKKETANDEEKDEKREDATVVKTCGLTLPPKIVVKTTAPEMVVKAEETKETKDSDVKVLKEMDDEAKAMAREKKDRDSVAHGIQEARKLLTEMAKFEREKTGKFIAKEEKLRAENAELSAKLSASRKARLGTEKQWESTHHTHLMRDAFGTATD